MQVVHSLTQKYLYVNDDYDDVLTSVRKCAGVKAWMFFMNECEESEWCHTSKWVFCFEFLKGTNHWRVLDKIELGEKQMLIMHCDWSNMCAWLVWKTILMDWQFVVFFTRKHKRKDVFELENGLYENALPLVIQQAHSYEWTTSAPINVLILYATIIKELFSEKVSRLICFQRLSCHNVAT